MSYFWVAMRAIIYVVIFSLVKIVVSKLIGGREINKDEKGKTYFDKKKISKFFLAIAIFFTVILAFLSTIPSNVEGQAKILLLIGIVVFCLIWYTLSLMYGFWYIYLVKNEIIYRNYIGKKIILGVEDIAYYERKANGVLCLYNTSKIIATFEPEYADDILFWLNQNKIKIKNNGTNKCFTVRPARYQRVLSVLCLLVFAIFLIVGIFTRNVGVGVGFGCLLMFGICNVVYHYTKKYVVGENHIETKAFLTKPFYVPFSEINKAEIKQGDNVSYILLYSKKKMKPLLKINTYYENAFRLEQLAYRKKWM